MSLFPSTSYGAAGPDAATAAEPTADPDADPRAPLRSAALAAAVVRPDTVWRAVEVVATTRSTHADLVAATARGAAEGLVRVAEFQSAGRGRLARRWVAPVGTGLTFSVLLRPSGVPAARWTTLPLLLGVALAGAVTRETGVQVAMKWPNDLLVGERKLAGLLAETALGAVVLGAGVNVDLAADELPVPTATSLRVEGAVVDRQRLLAALLDDLGEWYARWRHAHGDPVRCGLVAAYRAGCATLGRPVRVELPGGYALHGTAADVTDDGRLVVRTPAGTTRTLATGDVVHVRPA